MTFTKCCEGSYNRKILLVLIWFVGIPRMCINNLSLVRNFCFPCTTRSRHTWNLRQPNMSKPIQLLNTRWCKVSKFINIKGYKYGDMNLDMEKMWTSTLYRWFYWKIHIFLSNPCKKRQGRSISKTQHFIQSIHSSNHAYQKHFLLNHSNCWV